MTLEAYAHQDLPFDQLVSQLHPDRDLTHQPFFQVGFGLQNAPHETFALQGLTMTPFPLKETTAKTDIAVAIDDSTPALSGAIEYNTDLFDKATIVRMVAHWKQVLAAVAENPGVHLGELPILTTLEYHSILALSSGEKVPVEDGFVHQLIARQAVWHLEAGGYRQGGRAVNIRAGGITGEPVGALPDSPRCRRRANRGRVLWKIAGDDHLDPCGDEIRRSLSASRRRTPKARLEFVLKDARPVLILAETAALPVLHPCQARRS